MTTIDPATGLPELPEGHFWNIEENRISIHKTLPDTGWESRDHNYGYNYSYDEEGARETREVVIPLEPGRRGIKRERTETQYRYVNRHIAVKTSRYGDWDYVGVSWGWSSTKPDPVTKENIVARCAKVLEDWNEETERQKLYGQYPPKRLES